MLVFLAVLLVTVFAFAVHYFTAIQNPFDEMHYSVWQLGHPILGEEWIRYTKTRYQDQPGEVGGGSWNSDSTIYYKPSNIRENEYVRVYYNTDYRNINFFYAPYAALSDEFFISVNYNIENKQLIFEPLGYDPKEENFPPTLEAFMTENNIRKKDVAALQHRLIYDIILPNWFEGNQGLSKYSMENLGNFQIVDNTFETAR